MGLVRLMGSIGLHRTMNEEPLSSLIASIQGIRVVGASRMYGLH